MQEQKPNKSGGSGGSGGTDGTGGTGDTPKAPAAAKKVVPVSAQQDSSAIDCEVSTVDGRAERLRANLRRDIEPLTQSLQDLRVFKAIDLQNYLGFGETFKSGLREWTKRAKDADRNAKVVLKRITSSTRPAVYAEEAAMLNEVMSVCQAIVELCRTVLTAQDHVIVNCVVARFPFLICCLII